MSKNHKNVYTGFISIFPFASLFGIPMEIISSAVGLEICATTSRIKKQKSIINKKKKKHEKIVLFAKSKLNSIEVLIFKTSINSNNSHDEFNLTNDVLKEYDNMKEEINNLKTYTFYR